jgi:hypothetical protein
LPSAIRRRVRSADVYARITDRIVADLERGVRPWTQPWSVANTADRITRPLRPGQPYSGVNVILLWSEAVARGFASPIWMTFKQAIELGGHVRKGETGSTVVYASRFMKTETDGNGDEVERDIPFLKAYTVFCVDQIDDLHEHYYGRPTAVPSPIERNARRRLLRQYRRHRSPRRHKRLLRTVVRSHSDAADRELSRHGVLRRRQGARDCSLDRSFSSRQSRSQPVQQGSQRTRA